MRKFILILTLLNIFFNSYSTVAAVDVSNDILELDVKTAKEYAIKNNLLLKNNKIDLQNKLLSMATVWNQFIPSTSISASLGQSTNEKFNTLENKVDINTANSLSASFGTSLNLNAKMIFNTYQAVLDYQNGKLSFEKAQKKLNYDVEKNYYSLVILKEQILLLQKEVENSKSRYDSNLIKYEKSMISEIEKLKSEYDYKSKIIDEEEQNTLYRNNLFSFGQIIGIDDIEKYGLISPIPNIDEINYEKISNENLMKNFDIQALLIQIKNTENQRNLSIASLAPQLSLSFKTGASFNKEFVTNNWFENTDKDWDKNSSIGLSLSIPLDAYFPFSSNQTALIKSINDAKTNSNNLNDTIAKKKILLTNLILTMQDIQRSYSSLLMNKEIAEKTYQMLEQLYNRGNRNYLDLKDAENTLLDANNKCLQAKYKYLTNYLDLMFELNVE